VGATGFEFRFFWNKLCGPPDVNRDALSQLSYAPFLGLFVGATGFEPVTLPIEIGML
jgi:hypothetical protein